MTGIEWAAGLFTGEGTTYLTEKDGYPHINLRMGSQDAVERFKEAVVVGKLYGPYLQRGKQTPLYCYQADKIDDILEVIRLIYKELSKEKQEQIDRVMGVYYDGDWWF